MVAAAGSGERLGAGGPKALVELGGRPMLAWSLEAIRAAAVAAIVVAATPGYEDEFARVAGDGIEVVTGGETRAESVAAALGVVRTALVAIHDAARPLAPSGLFDAVLRRLVTSGEAQGVIAAVAVVDTIKEAGVDGAIRATRDRSELWAAQTPQAFHTAALRDAYAQAGDDAAMATDESMLVERVGGTVLIEPAGASNLKVTTPDDLRVAELLLSEG